MSVFTHSQLDDFSVTEVGTVSPSEVSIVDEVLVQKTLMAETLA